MCVCGEGGGLYTEAIYGARDYTRRLYAWNARVSIDGCVCVGGGGGAGCRGVSMHGGGGGGLPTGRGGGGISMGFKVYGKSTLGSEEKNVTSQVYRPFVSFYFCQTQTMS